MEIADISKQQDLLKKPIENEKTIAENFDVFLTLLTTQLKNQNPLEPVKSNEFTQQMVQFTSVEQQVKMNAGIEELGNIFQQNNFTGAVNYIGKHITAEGDTTMLQDNKATWEVDLPSAPSKSAVIIKDSFGKVVYSSEYAFKQGLNKFEWDGKSNDGNSLPDGLYTINVNAQDLNENQINVSTLISGVVTGVDTTGKDGMLNLGNRKVKIDSVKRITNSAT